MKIQHQFRERFSRLSYCWPSPASVTAQQAPQQPDVPTLSPAVTHGPLSRSDVRHCIVPQWDRGYILHREIDKDPAVVTMYDRNGKKILESHVEPPDAAKISLRLPEPRRPEEFLRLAEVS